MNQETPKRAHSGAIPFSWGMVLVTLGIVYGDIGTSPMYVMKAIIEGNGGLATVSEELILGALSLVIWTITLITTVKYVLIAMKADNHNEGGIFALYSLVRHSARWLILPAMIGGAALLADGILTPAVTVTTAIEGLRTTGFGQRFIGDSQVRVIIIVLIILAVLFFAQRSGTSSIGKAFGPIMTLWFGWLAVTGLMHIFTNVSVIRALNPLRGLMFLFSPVNKAGMMVLGSVFLCTTGAEALYSDMGHVGKANIYASWPIVKACLILNYLGQGAWILSAAGDPAMQAIEGLNPFYQMLPEVARPFAVGLSALAAIIASQALITGSYTLVSEATRLDLMPHMKVDYPSDTKGQLYIPLVNTIMWIGCSGVVLLFQTSSHMEAAYGLAITITMLMTTLLLYMYLSRNLGRKLVAVVFAAFFGAVEASFFFSSLTKFTHGGYVTVLMAAAIFYVMYVWRRSTAIERGQTVYLRAADYIDQLERLRDDESINLLASNLVFLTNDSSIDRLDRDILYSILDKRPKRAKAYWFVNMRVTDEPYTNTYTVNNFGTDFIFKVQLQLGFRVEQRVNTYLRQIVSDLIASGEIAPQGRQYSIYKDPGIVGDFRFVMIRKQITPESDLAPADFNTLNAKYAIRQFCGSPMQWYGLESSSAVIEYVPLFRRMREPMKLDRIPLEQFESSLELREAKRKMREAAKEAAVAVAPAAHAAAPAEPVEEPDIFSADVEASRAESKADISTTIIGGDTAVFDAIRDEHAEEEDEGSGE